MAIPRGALRTDEDRFGQAGFGIENLVIIEPVRGTYVEAGIAAQDCGAGARGGAFVRQTGPQ